MSNLASIVIETTSQRQEALFADYDLVLSEYQTLQHAYLHPSPEAIHQLSSRFHADSSLTPKEKAVATESAQSTIHYLEHALPILRAFNERLETITEAIGALAENSVDTRYHLQDRRSLVDLLRADGELYTKLFAMSAIICTMEMEMESRVGDVQVCLLLARGRANGF